MKVSEFFDKPMPSFLLGAFCGRFEITRDNAYFYTYSAYRNTTICSNLVLCEQSKTNYVKQLNRICSSYEYWQLGSKQFPRTDVLFPLENDLNLNKTNFFNRLYKKICENDFVYEPGLTEQKKSFIRGFCELRCSIDRSRHLLAMDYVYESLLEVKRVRLLTDYMNIPISVLNYNFREMQPQFINGHERSTQLRINIFWYGKCIGIINDYKAEIFDKTIQHNGRSNVGDVKFFDCIVPNTSNTTFEERLTYYYQNVFGQKITSNEISKFKHYIGQDQFDADETKVNRDSTIVELIRYQQPDICMCCGKRYNIQDRSFIWRKDPSRYYFEIHHVISLGRDQELDDPDNLAKLCPICHAALKRSRSTEQWQKGLIKDILDNELNIKQFCENYFDTSNEIDLIDNIWKRLQ